MTGRTLIRRSLRFHWRSHLGVVIGAAIGSAALIGALVVGDSVKGSLRESAVARTGKGSFLLHSSDGFFSEPLGARLRCNSNSKSLQGAYKFSVGNSTELPLSMNPSLPDRPMLVLPAVVTTHDGARRINGAQVIGLPNLYPALLPFEEWAAGRETFPKVPKEKVVLNRLAASGLGVEVGDTIVIRFHKPLALSGDSVLSPNASRSASLRLTVDAIATNSELAGFALNPSLPPQPTIFLPLPTLAAAADLARDGREGNAYINTWLAPEIVRLGMPTTSKLGSFVRKTVEWVQLHLLKMTERDGLPILSLAKAAQEAFLGSLLRESCGLPDYQIKLALGSDEISLTSERIFLDSSLEGAALAADTNAHPILTYIANLIVSGTNATPYSMITAAGAPWTPVDLPDDEIVLNQWLAEDLQAKPGDAVMVVYYDPESGARLTERTNTFRVHSIVPMEMPWADRTLMPDFPGIEKAESTADWDTAFPLTYKIRDKDDKYWQVYRGTPKAFVTLAAGKNMWANRFGELTAIRFPMPTNAMSALTPALSPGERENRSPVQPETKASRDRSGALQSEQSMQLSPLPAGEGQGEGERLDGADSSQTDTPLDFYRQALEQKILSNLDPAELGLRFEPVREQALKAAADSQDFGGLFIGFSLFLIAAALILMAVLFQFGFEQRSAEVGTLLALGFTHKQVRRLLLGEGAALAFLGGVMGVVGGVFYAKAMLLGLATVWKDAVGATTLKFFVTPGSLLIGLLASTLVAVFTIWLALRKQARRPAMELLSADRGLRIDIGVLPTSRRRHIWNAATVGIASLIVAVSLVGWALVTGETSNAGVFFGAGALVLIGGLAFTSARLKRSAGVPTADSRSHLAESRRAGCATFSTSRLSLRGLARRRSRSVATAALLASGSFLILSIGVFRLDADRDATRRDSGTGGFALIGESTIPVVKDLNTSEGREFFALNESDLADVDVVPFRVRAGDEASCLNLNRAQQPRLLGVEPRALDGRFTFAKVASGLDAADGWQLLQSAIRNPQSAMEEVPAIGDLNSILWAMGRKVGDTIDYTDDRGRPFKVRIVGAVANSILQGNLIIDEAEFVKRFPSGSGYEYFLLDAPTNRVEAVSAALSRALQDYGLEVIPAARRLNEFNAVQNTYLGTFQILGGLGLLLGSAGLGIVVLRNVLERRGELAVLLAVGFRERRIGRLVLLEHAALLGIGLAIGLLAAAVAVLPTLLSPGSHLPYATLVPTLLLVLLNGLIWTWAATRVALRGNLLEALRNE